MSRHRALLRARDAVTEDGEVIIGFIRDDVPIGTEYIVHHGHPFSGRVTFFNSELFRTISLQAVWVTRSDSGSEGLIPAQLLDIDEVPIQ